MFPVLINNDWDIKLKSLAEATMRKALNDLIKIREQYKLKQICSWYKSSC